MTRIDREKHTVRQMIEIYCRHKEGNSQLCARCSALAEYAESRLSRCPFGEKKKSCRRCPVHCYRPDMKERIREVMRFSGPRMIIYNPLASIRHLFK